MSIYEYDEEEHRKTIAAEAREDGIAEGEAIGEKAALDKVNKLLQAMLEDSRMNEIERMATDREFQEALFKKYGL